MIRRNPKTPRNFHPGDYYVARTVASADAFAAQAPPLDAPLDAEIKPLDAKKTAQDLGRVDEGFGTTPASRHATDKSST